MKRKYIIFLMYVLTSVCLFSIGFSSWTIVQNATVSTTGNIEASDMFNYDDYISFSGDIQGFNYCSTCFLNEDLSKSTYYDSNTETELNRGTCIINLKIKPENCLNSFNSNSIRVEIELKHKEVFESELDIFKKSEQINYTINYESATNVEIANISTSRENGYILSFEFKDYLLNYDNLDSYIENELLQIKIHFDLTNNQFMEIYDTFKYINFECIVRIEGC